MIFFTTKGAFTTKGIKDFSQKTQKPKFFFCAFCGEKTLRITFHLKYQPFCRICKKICQNSEKFELNVQNMKLRKILLKVFIALAIIFSVGAYVVIEHMLPYAGIKPYRIGEVKVSDVNNRGKLPTSFGLNYEPIEIQANDSIKLKGYFIKADSAICTIILLHGIGDCKEHFYGFCKQLADLHCNTIIMDSRAHGESGGVFCTFGYYEKFDVERVIDYAVQHNFKKPLGLFGNSLGGAIALQTLSNTNKLDFGIVESTFDRLDNVFAEYGKELMGFRSTWLANHVLEKSGVIAHFEPFTVNPVEACKNISCPIFMAHGTKDEKIPLAFGENNFNHLKTTQKEFVRVEGAGHLNLHSKGGADYWKKLSGFIVHTVERR